MKRFENKRIAFLGPRGTFTEEALLSAVSVKEEHLVPFPTVYDVIRAVEEGDAEKGIVPIENSIEGSVNDTLDTLTFEISDLMIEREIIVPIKHRLIVRADVNIKDINSVISHPQATAQCRKYLAKNLPGIEIVAANSTADAVRRVAEGNGRSAAIGTALAAKLYGLKVLEADIEDFQDNKTRFVLLGKELTQKTGKDKTSIVVFIYKDRPGSLLQILQEFAYRYINLTKIQSRPTKKGLGDYCFWIDMEGHTEDEAVASAIKCLKCKFREVKVLGSYPMADK
ncbi:MAG TPA: prephenate dehydratase [Actinobacteria bacterium]|nr:prephenate dehydratase [Actinomycetota bacterium]